MTITEQIERIGRTGIIPLDNGLNIKVTILDIKYSYGKVRTLVQPVEGFGQAWVERVDMITD